MSAGVLKLRPVRLEDEKSFNEAVAEFHSDNPSGRFDFALRNEDETFAQYVQRQDSWSRGENLPAGFVPSGFYVGIVDGEVVGRVSIRFRLNDFLARIGGHVGYGVRPSRRRRGYATRMLQLALPICWSRGVDRALLTCNVDNHGSIAVIERCGGVLESTTNEPTLPVQKRRYWIETA